MKHPPARSLLAAALSVLLATITRVALEPGQAMEPSVAPTVKPAVPAATPTPAPPTTPEGTPPTAETPSEGEALPEDVPVAEPDLTDLPVSDAARIRLERARESVVQIRSFFDNAPTSATHGSGFAAGAPGFIVTNYHVVNDAVLFPRQYRLEYVTNDQRKGRLQVVAVDVRNDLALLKAADLDLPPLRLRAAIPDQGERAYSIGFPLNLGLTITEGVANGVVANSLEQRIHYTGAINSGMSGGPALDARGAVYGVNVSLITDRQLVGFVVPAKHIEPLLAAARDPFDESLTARQARDLVTQQVLAQQAGLSAAAKSRPGTQTVRGYTLPTTLVPTLECATSEAADSASRLRIENIQCGGRTRLRIQTGLEVGDVRLQHRILHSDTLHPLQFAQQLNRLATAQPPRGAARDVGEFACRNSLVALDGFDARLTTCVRQYRLFEGLYDFELMAVSVSHANHAIVSSLSLRGTGFEPGQDLLRRYLETLQWTP